LGDSVAAAGEADEPPRQLALVSEPASAVRVVPPDARGERVQQCLIEVRGGGVLNRGPVEHRGLARGQERLLLEIGQQEITVVAADVRLAWPEPLVAAC
jgi:hypothetical protein